MPELEVLELSFCVQAEEGNSTTRFVPRARKPFILPKDNSDSRNSIIQAIVPALQTSLHHSLLVLVLSDIPITAEDTLALAEALPPSLVRFNIGWDRVRLS
jgi:hypothetical protein